MHNDKWIFFDIGSTLLDESAVYNRLFGLVAQQTGQTVQQIEQMVVDACKSNQNGLNYVVEQFGIAKPRWDWTLEKLYPDTVLTLQSLHGRYKLGIIANQVAGCKERLQQFGILQYFDVVVSSAEVGVAKPDAQIFEIALKQANCLPSQAIMVGDRIDNDILPANKIGFTTVWLRQGYGKYWQISNAMERSNYTIDSLLQLKDVVR